MQEYGPDDIAKLPRLARMVITNQLGLGNCILKDNGHIISFTGELVARLVRVTINGTEIEWFVQPLNSITIIETQIDGAPSS